jgi:hypothetical protein
MPTLICGRWRKTRASILLTAPGAHAVLSGAIGQTQAARLLGDDPPSDGGTPDSVGTLVSFV